MHFKSYACICKLFGLNSLLLNPSGSRYRQSRRNNEFRGGRLDTSIKTRWKQGYVHFYITCYSAIADRSLILIFISHVAHLSQIDLWYPHDTLIFKKKVPMISSLNSIFNKKINLFVSTSCQMCENEQKHEETAGRWFSELSEKYRVGETSGLFRILSKIEKLAQIYSM